MSTPVIILLILLVVGVGVGISFLISSWAAAMFILMGRTMGDEKEVKSPTWKEVTPLALLLMAEGFLRKVVKFENPLIQTILETVILAITGYFFVKLMRKIKAFPKDSQAEKDPKKKRSEKILIFVGFVFMFCVLYLINSYM